MRKSFYNTTNERGALLARYELAAESQEAVVLHWFMRHRRRRGQTPFEVQAAVLPGAPITSVRRAITNLTTVGLLERLALKRRGAYGRACFYWRLVSPAPDSQRVLDL